MNPNIESSIICAIFVLLILSYFCIIYSTYHNTYVPDENALLLQFIASSLAFIYGMDHGLLFICVSSSFIWFSIIIIIFIIYRRGRSESYLNV